MEERPRRPQKLDVAAFAELGQFEFRSAQTPEERASRLRREDAEAEHKLRMQAAEDAHKRLIALVVHIFALTILAVAFIAGVYVLVAVDPKTGLPDKAIAMVAGIALALASYVAGSKSK